MEKNQLLHDLRHSAAHLLAHAVSELYPGTKMTIGPVTEHGFFYDFLPVKNFKEEDLPIIEQRMRELAQREYHNVGLLSYLHNAFYRPPVGYRMGHDEAYLIDKLSLTAKDIFASKA